MQTSKVQGILGWKSYSESFHIVHIIRETTSFDCKCSKQLNFFYQRNSVIWVISFTSSFMFLRMRGERLWSTLLEKKPLFVLRIELGLFKRLSFGSSSFFPSLCFLLFLLRSFSSASERKSKMPI